MKFKQFQKLLNAKFTGYPDVRPNQKNDAACNYRIMIGELLSDNLNQHTTFQGRRCDVAEVLKLVVKNAGFHWNSEADNFVRMLKGGKGSLRVAYAIYFWFHTYSPSNEDEESKTYPYKHLANQIDEELFGCPIEELLSNHNKETPAPQKQSTPDIEELEYCDISKIAREIYLKQKEPFTGNNIKAKSKNSRVIWLSGFTLMAVISIGLYLDKSNREYLNSPVLRTKTSLPDAAKQEATTRKQDAKNHNSIASDKSFRLPYLIKQATILDNNSERRLAALLSLQVLNDIDNAEQDKKEAIKQSALDTLSANLGEYIDTGFIHLAPIQNTEFIFDVSPDLKYLLVADNNITIWDISTKQKQAVFQRKNIQLSVAKLNHQGSLALFLTASDELEIWDFNANKKIYSQTIKGIESAEFSNDSKYFVAKTKNNTVKVWHLYPDENELKTTLVENWNNSNGVLDKNTNSLWIYNDHSIQKFTLLNGSYYLTQKWQVNASDAATRLQKLYLSPSGKYVVMSLYDTKNNSTLIKAGRISQIDQLKAITSIPSLINLENHEYLSSISRGDYWAIAFDEAKEAILIGDKTKVRYFDLATGIEVKSFTPFDFAFTGLLPVDSYNFASINIDNINVEDSLLIYNKNTGKVNFKTKPLSLGGILDSKSAQFFKAQRIKGTHHIAYLNSKGVFGVLYSNQGKVAVFNKQKDSIDCLRFSNTKNLLAGCMLNGEVRVWDLDTKSLFKSLNKHKDEVKSIVFDSLDSKMLTTAGDHTIRMWNVQTGAEEMEPYTFNGADIPLEKAYFSRDSKSILIANLEFEHKDRTFPTYYESSLKLQNDDFVKPTSVMGFKSVFEGRNDYHNVYQEMIKKYPYLTEFINNDEENSHNAAFLINTDNYPFSTTQHHLSDDGRYIVYYQSRKNGYLDIVKTKLAIYDISLNKTVNTFTIEKPLNEYNRFGYNGIKSFGISSKNNYVYLITTSTIEIWNPIKSKPTAKRIIQQKSSRWSNGFISHDERYFVFYDSETIKVWHIKSGKLHFSYKSPDKSVRKLTVSNNSKYIAWIESDGVMDYYTGRVMVVSLDNDFEHELIKQYENMNLQPLTKDEKKQYLLE